MEFVLGRVWEWDREIGKRTRMVGMGGDTDEAGETCKEWRRVEVLVREKIETLRDSCRHQLAAARYQEKRIGASIQVVSIHNCWDVLGRCDHS